MKTLFAHVAKYLIAYGPLGVFVLSALDSMGIPLLAVLGSAGGNILLFIGARHGRSLFRRKAAQEAIPGRFQRWFNRYGLVTVFIPAVTPVPPLPLKFFVISAGVFRTP